MVKKVLPPVNELNQLPNLAASGEWKSEDANQNIPKSDALKKITDRLELLSFTKLYHKEKEPQQLKNSLIDEESLLVSLFDCICVLFCVFCFVFVLVFVSVVSCFLL